MEDSRIARVSEVISGSSVGFEDAIKVGFERAKASLRGITGLRVRDQTVSVKDGEIQEYRVRMEVIFVLDE